MTIEAVPSPNYNDRKLDVDMLVLHYTGMETGQAALNRMCDPAAEVSAHYMIWEDGRIAQLVGEDKRAWHAGVSSWQGDTDLNSRSIGIEIVNGGHDFPLPSGVLPPYPSVQVDALIELCEGILTRWSIPQSRIVGHSDIAPARKDDPGEHFPWERLASAGIGLWPMTNPTSPAGVSKIASTGQALQPSGVKDLELKAGDVSENVLRMKSMLQDIGYEIEAHERFDKITEAVVRAFQRRWVSDRVSGKGDLQTLKMIDLVHPLYTI